MEMEIRKITDINQYGIFILKRAVSSLILLFVLITFLFFLLRIAPGDPVQKFIDPRLGNEIAENMRSKFELDKPIFEQYTNYMAHFLTGDFGTSFEYRIPVLDLIKEYFPFTFMLALLSFSIQILFGYLLAFISFNYNKFKIHKYISNSTLLIYSIPSFVIAVLLVYLFSLKLKILPSSNFESLFYESENIFVRFYDHALHLIMPLIVLSAPGIAVFYKYIYDNIKSVSQQGFILYLRANGYSGKYIFRKHILPNTIAPLISIAGIELGILLGGALITEVIFSLPGMGKLTMNAIQLRDYPLVVGCTFFSALCIIVANFVADLLKVKLDKRLVNSVM